MTVETGDAGAGHPGNGDTDTFAVWGGTGSRRVAMDTDYYLLVNVDRLAMSRGGDVRSSGDLLLDVRLVRDLHRPADRDAVAIVADDLTIAYLPAPTAADYHEPLERLAARGLTATAPAHVHWWGRNYGDPHYWVRLDLAAPSRIVPLNERPAPTALVPGRALPVRLRPDAHEPLRSTLDASPWRDAAVWVSLWADERGGVGVAIDGTLVGELPALTGPVAGAVRAAGEEGRILAARAVLATDGAGVRLTVDATGDPEPPAGS